MILIRKKAGYFILPFFYALCFFITACHPADPVKRGFYYWKQDYNPTAFEKNRLAELKIKRLYIKIFDVRFEHDHVYPVAKFSRSQPFPASTEIIPVVFITNEALIQTATDSISNLAAQILKLASYITATNGMSYREFQVDCDWNEQTRIKYFKLLEQVRSFIHLHKALLSVTIRLHQLKYPAKTGIPPADRGMLMNYNMGKLNNHAEENSIYNFETASHYFDGVNNYKLPLDLALPAFSWVVQFRSAKVMALINEMDSIELSANKNILQLSAKQYVITTNFFRHGNFFQKGDLLRLETLTAADIFRAASQANSSLSNRAGSVALFSLDSIQQSHYDSQSLQQVFDIFN